MFALSRNGEKVFLHQPDAGMAVPVLLDLEQEKMQVRVPSVHELENEYAVFDEMSEFLRAVRGHRSLITRARNFSVEYSKRFREQLSTGKLTIAGLRKLVEEHERRESERRPKAASGSVKAAKKVAFAHAVTED